MAASFIPLPSFTGPTLAGVSPMASPSEKTVRHVSGKIRQLSAKSRQLSQRDASALTERVLGFLEARHPFNTAMYVARDARLNRPTVAKWFERRSAPSAHALACLIEAYGPDFLSALYGDALPWVTAAAWHERRTRFQAEREAFEAEFGAVLFGEGAP